MATPTKTNPSPKCRDLVTIYVREKNHGDRAKDYHAEARSASVVS